MNEIKSKIKCGILLLVMTVGLSAQHRIQTNSVVAWDAKEEADGYWVTLSGPAGFTATRFTSTNELPLLNLSTNLKSGSYTFSVVATNQFGVSPPGLLSTNLGRPPSGPVINIHMKLSLNIETTPDVAVVLSLDEPYARPILINKINDNQDAPYFAR